MAAAEMGMEINWLSQQGKRTSDNRDRGGVGVRADEVLCLVLDGSTSGPTSGDLARQITRDLIDWFVATEEAATAESLTAQLRRAHSGLGTVLVLHAGDCLLGRHAGSGPIRWLIKPHTLANVASQIPIDEIAVSHVRHRLTRSFRAREFMPPEATEIKAEPASSFIAATDGFWAELNAEEQTKFMQGNKLPMADEGDDRSILHIRRLDGDPSAKIRFGEDASENLYIKR
jgi:serine/threonine protein phosphatase PrpC